MKSLLLVLMIVFVSACTTMDQYFDGQTVTVDGEEYLVRRLASGSYQAMKNDPGMRTLLVVDAKVWANNVSAIEKATGCPVIPGSVANHNSNSSIAAVDCSKV